MCQDGITRYVELFIVVGWEKGNVVGLHPAEPGGEDGQNCDDAAVGGPRLVREVDHAALEINDPPRVRVSLDLIEFTFPESGEQRQSPEAHLRWRKKGTKDYGRELWWCCVPVRNLF